MIRKWATTCMWFHVIYWKTHEGKSDICDSLTLLSPTLSLFLSLFFILPPEWRRVSAGVRLCSTRTDRPVEGRAGEQRPLVCHAGGEPTAGPQDLRVHGCLRGQVGVHSDLSGWNRARGTAGPDPPSHSEQDATSWDSECHAGKKERKRCKVIYVLKLGLYLLRSLFQ